VSSGFRPDSFPVCVGDFLSQFAEEAEESGESVHEEELSNREEAVFMGSIVAPGNWTWATEMVTAPAGAVKRGPDALDGKRQQERATGVVAPHREKKARSGGETRPISGQGGGALTVGCSLPEKRASTQGQG